MHWLTDPEIWIALATLTALEIVLGIDNIIFIAILSGRLPISQQARARTLGLGLAVIGRVGLLLSLSWMVRLTTPLITVLGNALSGRDLILLTGGLFLLGKSTYEIHHRIEETDDDTLQTARPPAATVSFASVLIQILLLDLVFSLDSVITAIGMVERVTVMIAAVVIAIGIMMVFAGSVARFVDRHPTIKMLALSFLLLIGLALIAESLDRHIPKGYIYFAMAFSLFVEMLNLRAARARRERQGRKLAAAE